MTQYEINRAYEHLCFAMIAGIERARLDAEGKSDIQIWSHQIERRIDLLEEKFDMDYMKILMYLHDMMDAHNLILRVVKEPDPWV